MPYIAVFGGVFYSIQDLPPVWQKLSQLNPILYMIDGFRYGFYGIADVNVGVSIGLLVFFAAILSLLCLRLLKKGVGMRT